jgi:ABC-2 type transport system permease protein
LLVIANTALGGFVIAAISTRFVFPATSMEGQAFWILQKAPLTFESILRAKLFCWFIPVALISSIVLGAGALAINAEPRIIAVSILSSVIISYGLVGLATGLGAYFAKFNWEHSSQLTASFGSLIYLLAGGMLILVNVLPLTLMITLRTLYYQNHDFTVSEWITMIGIASCFLVILNYSATRWALSIGSRALEKISAV